MPNILHFGIGNFHRAHQAWYTQRANALGAEQWRITGVSLRSANIRDTLAPQAFAYTLTIKDAAGTEHLKIEVHDGILVGDEDQADIVAIIADAKTVVITVTVSEKGYHLDPTTGELDLTSPAIALELEVGKPTTTIGFIAYGLRARATAHGLPINIISCDNLPENGNKLQAAVQKFCANNGFALDGYLTTKVAFPNSMVDRIVPATTDALRTEVRASTGRDDAHPIATEAFSEWYLEEAVLHQSPDKRGVPLPVKMVSQLTQTWHSQVRSFC